VSGAEVAAANQKVWLYAQDGKTLVGSATTNSEGWADLGQQPEQFAIGYKVGDQFIYQGVDASTGELKVITPFNEAVELDTDLPNGGCTVSKAVALNGVPEEEPDDFDPELIEVRTNHPEWVAKLNKERNTITICAARAPLDGKFDLLISSKAGYQYAPNISWQGAASLVYSPQAPSQSSWSLNSDAPIVRVNPAITTADQLTIYSESLYQEETTQLAIPRLSGNSFTLSGFATYGVGVGGRFEFARPFTSLSELPSVTVPAPSISDLKWNADQRVVSWSLNSSANVDFFELSVDLGSTKFVTQVEKGKTSFTLPQLPAGIPTPDANDYVALRSVDYVNYNNLGEWLSETQSPLLTLPEFIEKLRAAEGNVNSYVISK